MNFKDIINEYVLPLFPGSIMEETMLPRPKKSYALVSAIGPQRLALMESSTSTERIVVKRSQPFTPEERDIIKTFIEGLSTISSLTLEGKLKKTLYPTIFKQAIAKALLPDAFETIVEVIDIFENLSGRTYEGKNLSLAIGIDTKIENNNAITIAELLSNDFGLVLSNGVHSIIVASKKGKIVTHEHIDNTAPNKYVPVSYLPVANWSKDDKVAILLNRNGEILLFSRGKLLFTKRRQKWQFYSHETIIKLIAGGKNKSWTPELRQAIYESLLDVSYARSGGLIGLISRNSKTSALTKLVQDDVPLFGNKTIKSKFVSNIGYPKFQDLPRRVRQEILAIDGCVLIDYQGVILNIGGIVTEIKPSSEGGARTAAAISLSNDGIAIKISMDGMIKGYKSGNTLLIFG